MGLVRVNLLRAHGTRYRYTKGCRCTSCRAANAREQRARRVADPDACREYARRYYAENRERVRLRNKLYRAGHREIYRESNRRHYQKCRRSILARDREYAKHRWEVDADYRAAARIRVRKRRSLKLAAGGTHSVADEQAQFKRQKGRCYWCGEKVTAYHVDHVIPLVLGGSNGPENLVISCGPCNRSKGAKHPMDFGGRLL